MLWWLLKLKCCNVSTKISIFIRSCLVHFFKFSGKTSPQFAKLVPNFIQLVHQESAPTGRDAAHVPRTGCSPTQQNFARFQSFRSIPSHSCRYPEVRLAVHLLPASCTTSQRVRWTRLKLFIDRFYRNLHNTRFSDTHYFFQFFMFCSYTRGRGSEQIGFRFTNATTVPLTQTHTGSSDPKVIQAV